MFSGGVGASFVKAETQVKLKSQFNASSKIIWGDNQKIWESILQGLQSRNDSNVILNMYPDSNLKGTTALKVYG